MKFKNNYKQIGVALLPMISVYLISRIFTYLDLFDFYFWLSPATHTIGGLVTAWTVYLLYKIFEDNRFYIKSELLFYLFLISLVSTVGIFWEFYEFLSKTYLGTDYLGDVNDTLLDLFSDLVGSLIFVVYLAKFKGLSLTRG